MNIPLADQIIEVKRELAIREGYYKRMVNLKRMSPSIAEQRLSRMQGVLNTLTSLEEKE